MTPGARIDLTQLQRERLVSYLDAELEDALSAHRMREARLDEWQIAYNGEPKTRKKNFPWPDACNVVIPLIGVAVDSIVARIVNTIFSVDPFWSTKPLVKGTEAVAKPVESFMEWSRKREFNMYATTRSHTVEVVKFGWGYIKVPWEVREVCYYKANGQRIDRTERKPNPQHILLMDIIPQAGVEDELFQAEWMAHRIRLTDGQLRWRQHEGRYDNVEEVLKQKEDISEVHERLALGGGSPMDSRPTHREKLNTLYECWMDFPLDREKPTVPIVVTYHKESRTVLRAIYNPHVNGIRPFVKAKFIESEGRLEGIGVARQLMSLQEEISTIHCQQVDNATIANTRFFVGRRGVIRAGTRIWPGRFLTVPDPERDIKVLQLGDVYQSMHSLELSALAYAERRSGVADYQLGRESNVVGSRATATGTLAVIQEGNRRFDLNVRDIRDSLGRVGQMVLLLNAQYRPKGVAYFVQGSDGQLTEKMLDLPDEFVADGLGIELTASTATINKEVERQGLIQLMGLVQQYYQGVFQGLTMAANPQVPADAREAAMKMVTGARKLMERVVQSYDVKGVDDILPPQMGGGDGAQGFGAEGAPQGDSSNGQLAPPVGVPG